MEPPSKPGRAPELATPASKGRIHLDISFRIFLAGSRIRFVVLPVSGRGCTRARGLPQSYLKDPADRISGATTLAERLPLLSADPWP